MSPLSGCVVWINGPPGVGKLTVANELSELLGPDVCPPPIPYNCDGEGLPHRAGEPAHVRRARMLDRVLFARRRRELAGTDPDPFARHDEPPQQTPAAAAAEDVIVFTDSQRLDTLAGREAAAQFGAAARASGRRFLAVRVACARAEHVRRATAEPARLAAQARWVARAEAARRAGVLPARGRHVRGPLVVDAAEVLRLRGGGGDDVVVGAGGLLLLLPPGCAGAGAVMDLDVTATPPREAAWLVMQRVRWEAVFGADRAPPVLRRRSGLLLQARSAASLPEPRQGFLPPPPPVDQQPQQEASAAASVASTGNSNGLARSPSPTRTGSRESLWVRSRRRWREAVPEPLSRAWRSVGLGRARHDTPAPEAKDHPERPTTRSMIIL